MKLTEVKLTSDKLPGQVWICIWIVFAISLTGVVVASAVAYPESSDDEPWSAFFVFGTLGMMASGLPIVATGIEWAAKKRLLQAWTSVFTIFSISLLCLAAELVAISMEWNKSAWWPVILAFGITGLVTSGVAIFVGVKEVVSAMLEDRQKAREFTQVKLPREKITTSTVPASETVAPAEIHPHQEIHMAPQSALFPKKWNEREISFALEQYRGSNLLTKYLGHIFSRFIIGQETETANRRLEFLRQFNEYSGVARESYKWQRLMAGGRAELEEDALDFEIKLKIKTQEAELARAQGDLEQIGLENETKRLTKQLEIERLKKQIAELQKPDYKPLERSQDEIKKEKREKIEGDIKDYEQKKKNNKADTELSEESRRRVDNMLSKKLDALHEKLEEYL